MLNVITQGNRSKETIVSYTYFIDGQPSNSISGITQTNKIIHLGHYDSVKTARSIFLIMVDNEKNNKFYFMPDCIDNKNENIISECMAKIHAGKKVKGHGRS